MTEPVIILEGVSKRYRLGEFVGGDLRETIAGMAAHLRRRTRPEVRELWSLRDVTLTVDAGQALGIIGANGAGKSTLLKIVSNITTPTDGRCSVKGRVGSLLEVGTGFHGELTGLENTYLNGAILGMSRREVTSQLDAIIEFAALEQFMDTPVKRYSSGMYLRLGFAIAAHLAADILLVDEVLAVGDAEFQRRCLGEDHRSREERTDGVVRQPQPRGDAESVRYCRLARQGAATCSRSKPRNCRELPPKRRRAGYNGLELVVDPTAQAQVSAVTLVDEGGHPQTVLLSDEVAFIQIDVVVREPVPGLDACVLISTRRGIEHRG